MARLVRCSIGHVTTRERAHALLDELPDSELAVAARLLDALRATASRPGTEVLLDDEPDDLDDADALAEARGAADRGDVLTSAQALRSLGLG